MGGIKVDHLTKLNKFANDVKKVLKKLEGSSIFQIHEKRTNHLNLWFRYDNLVTWSQGDKILEIDAEDSMEYGGYYIVNTDDETHTFLLKWEVE